MGYPDKNMMSEWQRSRRARLEHIVANNPYNNLQTRLVSPSIFDWKMAKAELEAMNAEIAALDEDGGDLTRGKK